MPQSLTQLAKLEIMIEIKTNIINRMSQINSQN